MSVYTNVVSNNVISKHGTMNITANIRFNPSAATEEFIPFEVVCMCRDQFLELERRSNVSIYTERMYTSYLNAFVRWLNGKPLATDTLKKYMHELRERVADTTCYTVTSVLRMFIRFLRFRNFICVQLFESLCDVLRDSCIHSSLAPMFCSITQLPEYVTMCDTVLEYAKEDYEEDYGFRQLQRYMMIFCLRKYGLRISETISLTSDNVQDDRLIIYGKTEWQPRELNITQCKTEMNNLSRCRQGLPLFGVGMSRKLEQSAVYSVVESLNYMCGFNFSPKTFRLTYMAELISAGISDIALSRALGISLHTARKRIRDFWADASKKARQEHC